VYVNISVPGHNVAALMPATVPTAITERIEDETADRRRHSYSQFPLSAALSQIVPANWHIILNILIH